MWPRGTSIDEALAYVAERADAIVAARGPDALPFRRPGNDAAAVETHAAQLDRDLPAEVTAMLQAVRGLESVAQVDACGRHVWPAELHEVQWIDPNDQMALEWLEGEHAVWQRCGYLRIAHGMFGDEIAWCADPPHGRPPGSIVTLDHEGLGPDDDPLLPCTIVVLADSLADWLVRWTALEFEEYGYLLGAVEKLSEEERRAFLEDHRRLNPGA